MRGDGLHQLRRVLAVLALTAVLAACAAEPATVRPDASSRTVASPLPVEQIDNPGLPLNAYTATEEERALVDRGYVTLLNRCMGNRGFPPRSVVPENTAKPIPAAWRYGVIDPAIAARYGYHTPPEYGRLEVSDRAEAERRYAEKPMSDTELRLHNECVDDVQRQLGKPEGGSHMDDVLAQTLAVTSFEQSWADPGVREVTRQWADCMRGKGFLVEDSLTVVDRFDLTAERPIPAEIATATADVECKRVTNLVGLWHAAELAYQHSLIQDNLQQLETGRRSVDTAVRVAARTLGVAAPK